MTKAARSANMGPQHSGLWWMEFVVNIKLYLTTIKQFYYTPFFKEYQIQAQEKGLVEFILNVMRANIGNCAICFYCCFSFYSIKSWNLKESVGSSKDKQMQIEQILHMKDTLGMDIESANGLEIIAKAIKTHIYSPKMCNYGNKVLSDLFLSKSSRGPFIQLKLRKEGAIEIALMGMTIHIENSEFCKGCSSFISDLAETSGKL